MFQNHSALNLVHKYKVRTVCLILFTIPILFIFYLESIFKRKDQRRDVTAR